MSHDEVSYHTRVSSVAIWKWMDRDQTMLESNGKFIRWVCCMFEPIEGIAAEFQESYTYLMFINPNIYLMFINPNILIRMSEFSCPTPYFTKHLFVNTSEPFYWEEFDWWDFTPEKTLKSLLDIHLFELIEFTPIHDSGYEYSLDFFFIERSFSGSVGDD
jgi:hypothetical protein